MPGKILDPMARWKNPRMRYIHCSQLMADQLSGSLWAASYCSYVMSYLPRRPDVSLKVDCACRA